MEYQEIVNLLMPFRNPDELPSPISASVESLFSFLCDIKDDDYLVHIVGNDSLIRLDYLKTLLWEACKCITIRRKEIELQCYHELFGDCFIKYDEDHIDDDELVLCPVVVENGKVVDILENHPRAYEYIERYYQTRYGPLDAIPSADDEDDYWDYSYLLKNAKNDEERLKIANDLYRFELNTSFNHQQEQSAIGTTVIHDGWQESIFDYGQPILNQRFGDKLIEIKRPIKRALDSIKEYCEHEMGKPRAFDELLKYS